MLTVSVDENLTAVVPVVEQRHLTFPIISISDIVIGKMVGVEGIPRTWIVDSTGSVRFEAIGYDPTLTPEQILHQLATLK